MDDKIDKAIEELIKKVSSVEKADDALKFTQAIMNIAHAKRVLKDLKDK